MPHRLVHRLRGKDALGVLHQKAQDAVFRLGEVDFLPIHPDPVAVQAQLDPVGAEHPALRRGARLPFAPVDSVPAQQSAHPGA